MPLASTSSQANSSIGTGSAVTQDAPLANFSVWMYSWALGFPAASSRMGSMHS